MRQHGGISSVYTIDPKDHLRIEREVENRDNEVIGVVHSHTHSEPFQARPMLVRRQIRIGTTSSCR